MAWIDALFELSSEYWAKTGKVLLLARVPNLLRKKGVDLQQELAGRKLRDAILVDAVGKVRIVQNPNSLLEWGVLPSSVDLPSDIGELFVAKASDEADADHLRYARGVWLAFSKPLEAGMTRYLVVGPPARLHDVEAGEMPPSEGYLIDSALIYEAAGELLPNEARDEEIESRIRDWAKSKSIELDLLKSKWVERRRKPGMKLIIDLSVLSQSEKSRILIPLDIFEKLRME